jgi:hypothetical protein
MHWLIAALENLAKPAAEQEAYLRELGTAPCSDELALEFSEALCLIELEGDVRSRLDELDAWLHSMSGSERAQLWQVSALHSAPEWAEVRRRAAEGLALLKERSD